MFGVPCEKFIIIVVSYSLSFDNILLSFFGSQDYVRIRMTVASIHCLMPSFSFFGIQCILSLLIFLSSCCYFGLCFFEVFINVSF